MNIIIIISIMIMSITIIIIIIGSSSSLSWDRTNPPHPHQPLLFDKSKVGFIKRNNLLTAHKTELVDCSLNSLN